MSLIRPGDLPSLALQKHDFDHDVVGALKRVVERHKTSNEKEHERLSLERMRKTIQLAYPGASETRVDDIIRHQLRPTPKSTKPRITTMTARDFLREERKAGVKSRRRCRD